MNGLTGQLPPGDPDFDLLKITGGTAFGMPSPGHTTLTLQATGDWKVDSFFDITYKIDFTGKPGGHLGGMSGSTTGTIRMSAGPDITAPPGIPFLAVAKGPGGVVQMSWTSVAGASTYDGACGDLGSLRGTGGNFTIATNTCASNNNPMNSAPFSTLPSTGGSWCVVRPQNIGGIGTYDEGGSQVGGRDTEINASTQACP
jgi:hypothetical protein